MTVLTDHYHALTCNGRVDNIVTGNVCTTRSAGRWHDAEAMETEALDRGWTKNGRGHLCPSCSAAVVEQPAPAPPKAPRARKAQPEQQPPAGDGDWSSS